jgi:hypothetical protein
MTILTALLVAWTLAQAPAPSGATIDGIVVDFKSGNPIEGAIVELRSTAPVASGPLPEFMLVEQSLGRGRALPTFTTGPDGKFRFNNPMPGEYRLYATRIRGHVPAEYGQRTPTGTGIAFTVANGQRMSGITLRMAPVGSISGRVVDADGDPVQFASVELIRPAYQDGKRRLTIVVGMRTDDRGEYRLHSIPPGEYYVAARPWDSRSTRGVPVSEPTITPNRFGAREVAGSPLLTRRVLESGEIVEETWMPVYYPGTPDPRAARLIPLNMGEDIGGIDLSLALSPALARRVSGVVLDGATGLPVPGALVRLTPREQLTPSVIMPMATADAKGVFDVPGVLPSTYSLFVTGPVTAYMAVDAGGGDVANLQIVGVKGVDIPVRLTFDDGAVPPPGALPVDPGQARPPPPVRVTFIREPGTGSPTGAFVTTAGWPGIPGSTVQAPLQAAPDGSFLIRGAPLGDYRINVDGLIPGAYVKSIRRGQVDVLRDGLSISRAATPTDEPLEIAIGANAGVLTGRVLDDAGEPAPNVTVALVPSSVKRARIDLYKNVSTDNTGRFRFQGIAPDEYKLFSWEEVLNGAWHDPDFIRGHEIRGVTVTIGAGTNPPQELKVIP